MTTLPNRTRTALLVIDMQNGVVANAFERDSVVANIGSLVERARSEDVPVIWIQHSDENMPIDSDGWQHIHELTPLDGEHVIGKTYGDSFEDTSLGEVLSELTVGHVVITGAQTEMCVRSTLHGAFVRGYDTTLVSDAHTTEDMREWGFPVGPVESIAYTNMYWTWAAAPGRTGSVVATAEVDFSES
jgi:nicotinamidase-related amidase